MEQPSDHTFVHNWSEQCVLSNPHDKPSLNGGFLDAKIADNRLDAVLCT